MIKVIAPARRHPEHRGLADFHRYWRESHGPLYANTRALRGYVQHLTLPEAYGGQPAPTYDGVSMFIYDDLASQGVPMRDPDALRLLGGIFGVEPPPAEGDADPRDVALLHAVLRDDAQLFDRSTTWPMHDRRAWVAAEERVIVHGPAAPDMVKAIFIASKLPGLTLLEFLARWEHVHGPLVARLPGLRRYVQDHALPAAYAAGLQTHDGFAELWFDDLGALREAVGSPEWQAVAADGATLFAAPMGVGVARETVQKDASWAPRDWGVRDMLEEDVRARLRDQGYEGLAADPGAPAAIRRAAGDDALAVWTEEHIVTIDASAIAARPATRG